MERSTSRSSASRQRRRLCELPGQNVHVVDVPVPADGERLTLAVAPGDALRLACSFRDVHGAEVGNNLEMTFPGGGVVVVENFSEWIAAKGSTISDCVCGGVNPADFIVALGLNPEDILPAAGGEGPGGPLPADSPSFAPGPGPEILHSFDHPHILPPTALGYGLPEPDKGLVDEDEENNDLGGPIASAPDPLRVVERTGPLQGGTLSFTLAGFTAAAAADVDDDGCVPPTGPVQFVQDQASGQIFTNDDFGPDGRGNPPLFSLVFTGALLVDAIHGILQGDGHTLRITSLDSVRPGFIDVDILTGLTTVHLTGAFDHGGKDDGANIALETFNYTIQDKDGDKSTTQVTIEIVDSVPVAHDDCEVCIVEPGRGTDGVNSVGGNVMLNDDLGADQFLPAGTDLISFTYDNGTHTATVPDGGLATVTTAVGGTLTVHSNGDWTYTPPATVDNSNGDVHDNFTYTIRDGDGDTSQAVQPICIQDGADPEAFDNKQCVNEGATQNVVIIADVSGSMDDDDLDPDPAVVVTRLDLEKLALAALVDKYAALAGTVTITLIAFSSGPVETAGGSDTDGALNLGTFTFASTSDAGYAAAIAAISSLAVGLGPLNTETEYDDALITAQNVLTAQLPGQSDGTTNTVYFLSDGEPNPASNDAGATGWKAFVDANHIEVVAIGMGDDIAGSATAIAELTEVEDDGDAPIIVNDKGDLAGLVIDTAGNASVSGNVLLDPTEELNISPANDPVGSVDDFGSDGAGAPKIISLQQGADVFTNASAVGGDVVSNDGHTIVINTDLGGLLSFNFDTGAYTYTAPDVVDHGENGEVDERFTYTIQDTDGDTDPADLVICIKDNVEPPTVTMAIGVNGQGDCVEEDSVVTDPDNKVAVHAEAVADDTLTQLVITGFNQEPGWTFDFAAMNTAGVTGVVYNAAAGTLTVTFGPDVKVFDGTFGVQPPADSDVDLGTLTATATAAAAGDPTQTLDSSTNLDVTVDANADPVEVTAFAVSDTSADGSFSPNETGTLHLTATFGDSQDGSETHTVTVEVPSVFNVTNPAGGVVTNNLDGSHTITFTLDTTGGSDDFSADIGIQATNAIAQQQYQFDVTVQATETTTGDDECDTSDDDNIATETASTTTQGFDDHPTAYDNKQCVNEGASQNVVVIADVSGSMDDDDLDPGPGCPYPARPGEARAGGARRQVRHA